MGKEAGSDEAIDLAALLCSVQVGLLVALKGADLLKEPPTCPLAK